MADGVLQVTAAVLAGGRSVRMGVDKRALAIGDETMLSRVVRSVSAVCDSVLVVIGAHQDASEYSNLGRGVEVVADCVPDFGPMGGLVTALTYARNPWIFLVGADMPLVCPEVVGLLCKMRGRADAVVPVTPNGPEPLLALYNIACLRPALELLGTPRGGPRRLLELVESVEVPAAMLRQVDPNLGSLRNVNTPADYAELIGVCGAVPMLAEHSDGSFRGGPPEHYLI